MYVLFFLPVNVVMKRQNSNSIFRVIETDTQVKIRFGFKINKRRSGSVARRWKIGRYQRLVFLIRSIGRAQEFLEFFFFSFPLPMQLLAPRYLDKVPTLDKINFYLSAVVR